MFKPIELSMGLRYVRAKRKNHFISFISLVSMLGIGLGVAVLITVLSVMNGFDSELKNRILGMMPHVMVVGPGSEMSDWKNALPQLQSISGVQSVAPFVETPGMMSTPGVTQFVQVTGILPDSPKANDFLKAHLTEGLLTDLVPGEFKIILGEALARYLNAGMGDFITLAIPETRLTAVGLVPRFKRFEVAGLFKVDYDYDASWAYIHLNDAQTLLRYDDNVTGIHIKLDDIYAAREMAYRFQAALGGGVRAYDWTFLNGTFFEAVKLEKTMMFIILTLIIAVASFNILSMLIMVVTDKRADIAILKTMGATSGQIIRIFVVQGSIIGLLGTLLGVLGGILLAQHITEGVELLEQFLGTHFISSDVYYISFLPSVLQWKDVVMISMISLGMSFVATIYPAWRASKIHPAEALRYE